MRGVMFQRLTATALGLLLLTAGCTGDGAKELFDTAQLEEQQSNQAHASELYREIKKKYPHSEYAKKAEERLRTMAELVPQAPSGSPQSPSTR
jgi:outer membrane protein assembly factor BamD (BamD/ComL family)